MIRTFFLKTDSIKISLLSIWNEVREKKNKIWQIEVETQAYCSNVTLLQKLLHGICWHNLSQIYPNILVSGIWTTEKCYDDNDDDDDDDDDDDKW